MKYIYYTLHLFLVKLSHNNTEVEPVGTVTSVMTALIMLLCLSLINVFVIENKIAGHIYEIITIPLSILSVIIARLLYRYYEPREESLLKGMNRKPESVRIIIIIISTFVIISLIKISMFGGMEDIYYFLKEKIFNH